MIVSLALILLSLNGLAGAHENEKYRHQSVGMRFGGGFMWGGIYRTFVNEEHTQCRDLIYTHNKMHATDPFECDDNLKDLSQED
jgi:hypothetical protein